MEEPKVRLEIVAIRATILATTVAVLGLAAD